MKKHSLLLAVLFWSLCAIQAFGDTKMEAEDASYSNCKLVTDSKYSGGKALELTESSARISFSFSAAERGKYTIYVGYDGLYGEKKVDISVNGGTGSFQVNGQAETSVGTYIMKAGSNSIVITPNWTWFRIDYIRLERDESTLEFDISPTPVDAEAAPCAQTVYTFLYDNFGKRTLSGIMTGDLAGANNNITLQADVKAVYQA